jgi:glycosyltransferase involved in cell wall biosynthesis
MTIKTAVFTIVSLNYGAFARTLMESLYEVHPEWDRHVLLVDRHEHPATVGGDLFTTSLVEDLPLPKMSEFLFRYDIMELNTAVKPYMFAKLRREGYQRMVYIDPDILVVDRLVDVERLLDEGANAVVTPHLTAPLDDGLRPNELDIMRAGAYNLGFLALGDTAAADDFIAWWQDKLEYGAVSDPARGLFTDQKWVDLAPGMFGGFAVLRDPGYNVAYWNLPHRPVTRENDVWLAGGRPLRFFHFSGFDPQNPQPFSKHQDRLTLDTIGAARELALIYAAKVLSHGHAQSRTQTYAFATFDDGTKIPSAIRALYREDSNLRFFAGANPFANVEAFANGESDGLPTILRGIWLQEPHMQRIFPDPLGISRHHFHAWFVEVGAAEAGIGAPFLPAVQRSLHALEAAIVDKSSRSRFSDRTLTGASIWARGLIFLHRRATGGVLSAARMRQYEQVTGPLQFLSHCIHQFRGSRWAARLGLGIPNSARANFLRAALDANGTVRVLRWRSARYAGLYAEFGKEVWWVGMVARFKINCIPNGTLLRLRGIYPEQSHLRAHGHKDMLIDVGFDDYPRVNVTVSKGTFDVTVNLESLPQNWPATLHVVPQRSFVPSEIGVDDDHRRLTFQIHSLDIGDTNIFHAMDISESNNDAEQGAFSDAAPVGVPGVNVIGYARSEHGVGQSLRQFVSALDANNIPSVVMDFTRNNLSRVQDGSLAKRLVIEPKFAINVFHINADQMPQVQTHMPANVLKRYNIGFWHWELPEMLESHLAGFDCLNEVWVPSAFVQDAVARRSPVPVVRMPHAIHFTVSPNASRQQFNLPDNKFLFLMMYDFSSYQERKNPQAALEAFERAFAHDNHGAVLVIKTQNAQFHTTEVQALHDRIAGRHDVIWINETLSRQQVYDLVSVCDSLISLHRSEGFGLGPAEAMFLGKPVIATNWSGNTEFMRADNSLPVNFRLVKLEKNVGVYPAGQTWAEPDVVHAASLMQQIVDDGDLRARISQEAKRTMQEEFSPELIGRRIAARLAYIKGNLTFQ